MTTIRGLRYFEVDFNADGGLNTDTGAGSGGLPEAVAAGGISDVFVFSHGWNTGVASAQDLYNDMFGQLADQLGPHLGTSAAVGVIWPSLLFPDDAPASEAELRDYLAGVTGLRLTPGAEEAMHMILFDPPIPDLFRPAWSGIAAGVKTKVTPPSLLRTPFITLSTPGPVPLGFRISGSCGPRQNSPSLISTGKPAARNAACRPSWSSK